MVVQLRTSPFVAVTPCTVVTSYTYDRAGNRTSITDANNHTRSAVFDAADRQIIARDPLNQETQWDYDQGNRITLQRDPRGSDFDLSSSYDELDRPTELSAIALTAPITTTYDTLGRRTHMGDATGVTAFSYDALNRVTGVTAPATGSIGYSYDARGLRTRLTYPDSSAIDYTYDADGQLAGVWQDSALLAGYSYTSIGQVYQVTRAITATTTYGYDGAGRLTDLATANASDTLNAFTYTLDRRGLRTAVEEGWQAPPGLPDGTGTGLEGEYYSDVDLNTLVLTRTDSLVDFDWVLGAPDGSLPDDGFSVRWRGAIQPRVTGIYTFTTTADDGVRLWVNDELVIDDWTTHTSADTHQGVTSAALTAGQPYTLTLEYFEDTDTAEVQLEWESIQQVREIVPTSQLYPRVPITLVPSTPLTHTRVLTYTYDGLQRLTETQEVGPTTTTAYSSTYDLAGNRLEAWTNGVLIQNHSYDAANQVSGWSYDAAGNLTSDGTTTNTWDALNRLTVQGTTSNAYNGDGVLVGQIVGSAAITYTQDLIAPLSQILSDGTSQYVYGADRLFGVAGGTRTWYLSDALGSVRQTFDDAGFVQQALRYDAWGVPQGAAIAPFGYTGELQQGNQVYLRARWYNAGNGAFGSRDPFAGMAEMPYSLHSYQYGYSNPVLNTDPTGKYSTSSIEEMIQRRYEHMYTIGIFQDEYPIYLGSKTGLGIDPATGRLGGNLSDIVNSGKLDIVDIYRGIGYAYEIKNERDQARGSLEIDRYIDIYRNLPLPKSPKSIPTPPDVLVRGSNFPSDRWENPGTNPYYFGSTIIARLGEPGVIVWKSIRNNQPIPIIVDVKVDYRIKQPRSNMQPVPAFAYNSCAILFPGIIPLNPFGGNNGGNDEDDVYNYPRENTPPFLPYKPLLPNNTPANNALF